MGYFGRIVGAALGGVPGYFAGKTADENPQKVKAAVKHYTKTLRSNPVGAVAGSLFGPAGMYLGARYLK